MRAKRWMFVAAVVASAMVMAGCVTDAEPKTELVFWHQESPANRVKAYQELIDDFNASHPYAEVRQEVQDWNTIYPAAPAAITSGTGPDVLMTMPELSTYIRQTGAAQPVTDFVHELDRTHHYLGPATEPYHDQGEYWGVPLWGMVQLLWYRKDAFREAGIDTPPRTWEEVESVAQRLTKKGRYGITLPANRQIATDQTFYSFMLTYGAGELFDGDEIAFDNPDTVRALAMYVRLLQYAPPDSASYGWAETEAAFNSGSAAMHIDKGVMLSIFTKDSGAPATDLGCAPIPQPELDGQPGSSYASNAAMILTKDGAKQRVAKDFIRFLMESRNYGPLLNAQPGLFLPVTQDGFELASWRSDESLTTWPECTRLLKKQSQSGALYGFTNGTYHSDIGPIAAQNIMAQTVQKAAVGGASPREAVAWGQRQMEAAVK